MYAAESVLLRVSIVLGMVAAVVTILYFSPVPNEFYQSCDRPCHALDWPMICRIKLTIETQKTANRQDCLEYNETTCDNENGSVSGILSANNLLPGPSIQVCQNDVLIVDVINKLSGHGVAIHWRGQPQNEAPFMDGTPMITQCPINSYTTFQYKFRASSAGTHLWHTHAGSEVADGFFGALVVRKAIDPQKKLYDYDDKSHIILLSEWTGVATTNLNANKPKPKAIVINGKSIDKPIIYNVKTNKRYRFRVAYGGGITGCPIKLTIDEHPLKIISLDGTAINPSIVDSITISKGERIDFVLKTNRDVRQYKLYAKSQCDNLEGGAIINYEGDNDERLKGAGENNQLIERRDFTTHLCESKIGHVCLADVHAIKKLPKSLKATVDRKIYLPFDYKFIKEQERYNKIYMISNITFTYPPSPLLTQFDDVNADSMCSSARMPERCNDQEICECIHVESVDVGSTVELLLIDHGGEENVFHLHGYNFYVVGSRTFKSPISIDDFKTLDDRGMFKRNLISPVQKDTIRVPKYGVVAVRFLANNPGFWMLRDGNANQWTRGLDMVFHVGTSSNLPKVPSNFPTCGSWIGPDFFLL